MKRGVFDLLRRGFDNTVANWQLSLIRFLQSFLFVALAIGGLIAIVVPFLVSAGIHINDLKSPDEIESAMLELFTNWMLLVWIVIGVFALLLIYMLIYSFVEAGCARVFVDADRIAGPELNGPRARYRVFSFERWMAGGRSGWWTVFWIYNIVWGIVGLILLVPLLPTLALVVLFRENEGVAVLSGCLGLAATVMLMIVVAFVGGIWSYRAVVAWAAHHTGAMASTRIGWQAIKGDLARHVLPALAMFLVGMAISAALSSFSMFSGFADAVSGSSDVFMMVTMPLRIAGSLLNSAFSAALASWFLATYAALAVDR